MRFYFDAAELLSERRRALCVIDSISAMSDDVPGRTRFLLK